MSVNESMPVFTIKAKDLLAIDVIDAYIALCYHRSLNEQAAEVWKAREEIRVWQEANPERLQLPDHPHIPVASEE